MSRRRNRRWTPRGTGWRRLTDSGNVAWWVRRTPAGEVENVVYIDRGVEYPNRGSHRGIWTFIAERDAEIMWQVWDKKHRVSLIERITEENHWLGGRIVSVLPIPDGPTRRPPCTVRGEDACRVVHRMRRRRRNRIDERWHHGRFPRKFAMQ